jgi:serine/threonine-protein kinase
MNVPGYELLGEIAGDWDRSVYKARDTALDQIVALTIHSVAHDPFAQRARLLRQGEIEASLREHPHIVAIREVGEHEGASYVVHSYIEGQLLNKKVGDAPQPPRDASPTFLLRSWPSM